MSDRGLPDLPGNPLCDVVHGVVERATTGSATRHGSVRPVGDILERFHGTGGVPAAVGEETVLELVPVFAALDAFEREAAAVREQADKMVASRLHKAEEGAEEILAATKGLADSERGDALKAGLRAADAEAAQIVAQAEADARRIDEIGGARIPVLVDEIISRVLGAS